MKPLISVITITYNDIDGFLRTAASVIPQLSLSVEWIVKDGGSQSATLKEIDRVLSCTGCIFRSSRDNGVYDAMNKASSLANGDWLIFMNGGDAFVSDSTIARILDFIWSRSLDPSMSFLLAGGTELVSVSGQVTCKPSRPIAECMGINSYRMAAFHQSQIYSRSIFQKQRFREELSVSADHAFFWDAIINGAQLLRLDFPVSRFYVGGLSTQRRLRSCLDVGYSIFMIQDQVGLVGLLSFFKRLLASYLPRLWG